MAPAAAAAAASARKLPSASEIDAALAPYSQSGGGDGGGASSGADDGKWRILVLQILAYGTDYDISATGGDGAGSDGSDSGASLPTRYVEAAQCLVDGLGRYAQKHVTDDDENMKEDGEDAKETKTAESPARAAALDWPRSVLTDCLWLVGTMLESDSASAAAAAKGGKKRAESFQPPANPRYDALAGLVNAISYGTSLKLSDDDGDGVNNHIIPAVPIPTLQRRLEPSLLASSNLLLNRTTKTLVKRFTTANTNAYYRQNRFNLLQEESEGWSKLLTFLGSLPGTIGGGGGGGEGGDDEEANGVSVRRAQTKVRELIGAFDLDPNRVLDLIVDTLESEVTSLLAKTKGKATATAAGTTSIGDLFAHAPTHATPARILLGIIADLKRDSLPHLLGFKYANYAASGGGSGSLGPTPPTLHLTTALLILHGLVEPARVVKHLAPSVDKIQAQYEDHQDAYVKKIKKMGTVSLNAAASSTSNEEKKDDDATATAVTSDASTAAETTATAIENNQVVGLFHALVEAGAPWDVAISVFSGGDDNTFNGAEAVATLHEPTGKAICSWVKRSIAIAYDGKVKSIGKDLMRPASNKSSKKDGPGEVGRYSLLPDSVSAKTILSPSANLEDVSAILAAPLSIIIASGSIQRDPSLYCMLCRLVKTLVPEGEIDETTYSLLRTFLVPCMSLFPANPSISMELWSVLAKLPYQIRYGLYGSSRLAGLEKGATRTSPRTKALPVIESEVQTGIEIRYSLKRLSKDNIKETGRQLSKVSHSNPLVVFTTILNQIESYDNLIQMMVDTFVHVTELSLDVLGYCLLVALGGGDSKGGRSKLKEDGVNAAQWLSSLETFAGAFYKKFPSVEMHGLLAYLVRRLEQGEILELGVFRTLLTTAGSYGFADCESTAGLSDTQLDGRAGSQLLKRETSDFGIVEKFNRKASLKLRSVLQDSDVGAVILILLSQIRSRILYHVDKSTPKHIKLLGSRYDSCQMVLSVLTDFLTDTTEEQGQPAGPGSIKCYASSMPELSELHQSFGLEPAVSWMLCRPLIRAAMFEQEENEEVHEHLLPYLPHTDTMKATSSAMLPEACWQYLTQDLFEMFYSHSLYDIHCPETRYKTEIVRLDKDRDRLNQLKKGGDAARGMMASMAAAAAAAGGTEREIRQATAFTKEHEKDLERLTRHSGLLSTHMKRQKKHCGEVRKTFELKKASFLSGLKDEDVQKLTAETFLTYCVYPRCRLTPEDALYCAEFVMLLHTMEVPGFFTLKYVDCLINAVVGAAYSITEDEAGNLSVLLKSTWAWIKNWRDDKAIFDKEVAEKVRFCLLNGDGVTFVFIDQLLILSAFTP